MNGYRERGGAIAERAPDAKRVVEFRCGGDAGRCGTPIADLYANRGHLLAEVFRPFIFKGTPGEPYLGIIKHRAAWVIMTAEEIGDRWELYCPDHPGLFTTRTEMFNSRGRKTVRITPA